MMIDYNAILNYIFIGACSSIGSTVTSYFIMKHLLKLEKALSEDSRRENEAKKNET
jgi:hypothetical protein